MKIFHKLLLSFLVFVLLIWLVGYLAVSRSQDALKIQIGKSSVPFMQKLISSELSEELREYKAEFYEEKHGQRVFGEVFVTNRYGGNIAQTGKTTD